MNNTLHFACVPLGKLGVRLLALGQHLCAVEATPASAVKIRDGFAVERIHSVPVGVGGWVAAMCFAHKGRIYDSNQSPLLLRITPTPLGSAAGAECGGGGQISKKRAQSRGCVRRCNWAYLPLSPSCGARDRAWNASAVRFRAGV